jgi:hypothetical protein
MMWPPKKGAISTTVSLYSTASPSSALYAVISPACGAYRTVGKHKAERAQQHMSTKAVQDSERAQRKHAQR